MEILGIGYSGVTYLCRNKRIKYAKIRKSHTFTRTSVEDFITDNYPASNGWISIENMFLG